MPSVSCNSESTVDFSVEKGISAEDFTVTKDISTAIKEVCKIIFVRGSSYYNDTINGIADELYNKHILGAENLDNFHLTVAQEMLDGNLMEMISGLKNNTPSAVTDYILSCYDVMEDDLGFAACKAAGIHWHKSIKGMLHGGSGDYQYLENVHDEIQRTYRLFTSITMSDVKAQFLISKPTALPSTIVGKDCFINAFMVEIMLQIVKQKEQDEILFQ